MTRRAEFSRLRRDSGLSNDNSICLGQFGIFPRGPPGSVELRSQF
jgi:hypothetical protein